MRDMHEKVENGWNAEATFRAAFERLKSDCPALLKQGTPVSQNNVAREAGRDPSALRKSRYPELISEISAWVCARRSGQKQPGTKESKATKRARRRSQDQLTADLKLQRDRLASLLVEADAKILDLTLELARLRPSSNVTPIRR